MTDPGQSYNESDAVTTDNYGPVNVSNCTSVNFTIDYSSSLPWAGSGNMESVAECGGCNGQPLAQVGCANCWDFFYVEYLLDGNIVGSDIVGMGVDPQNATFTFSICTNGASNASMNVYTQTWAGPETISFTNIEISCLEPGTVIDPGPICETDVLTLDANYPDPSYIASSTWSSNGGANIANVNLVPTTASNVTNGEVFTLTSTDDNGCSSTDDFTAVVDNASDAGTNGSITVCTSDNPFNLFNQLGGTPDAGGSWNPGNGTFDPATDASGVFTYTVNGNGACPNATATVTVTVQNGPDAGTNGSITLCETDPSTDLFNALGGTPDPGGVWTPALSSGTGVFNPSIDLAGVYTYTVSAAGCGTTSATVNVAVNSPNDAGINGAITLCSSDPSVDLFNSLGGTPDGGGIWTPALTSGTGVFDPAIDASGTYTYTVPANGNCPAASADVNVSVSPAVDAGISGSISLCTIDPSVNLYNILGGTPDPGGFWSPALASGTGVFDPTIDAAGIYTYTVLGTNPCPNASTTVTVTLNTPNDPGINGAITLCSSDPSVDLFNSLGGTPDLGGTWTPALTSGTGVFNPAIDAAGNYTYTVPANGNCPSASADVVVNVNTAADAGVNGNISLCTTDPSVNLFNILGGTPDAGGFWSPALASGTGIFDPAVDAGGTYTYTVLGTNPCPNANATVTVTVNSPNDPGTNGAITLCSSDPSVDLLNSLGGTPDLGGTWTPALTSGTGVFDPAVDAAG
ncbi:MAG: hypothetical protein MRY83_04250, partial [Flavobacteriales bacterium]|nr:hypothetical protein [Flavobacteriales bacterium]